MFALTAALMLIAMPGQAAEPHDPALLCFPASRFRLAEGESVEAAEVGLHSVSLTIRGPSGTYVITEAETMRTSRDPGVLIRRDASGALYRSRRGYSFMVPDPAQGQRMIVTLTGRALTGGEQDAAIHGRVTLGAAFEECDAIYGYGRQMIE